MRRRGRGTAVAALAAFAAATGCAGAVRDTTTPRGSQELLLLSTAAERAVARIDTEVFAGRRVAIDATRLDSVDRGYVLDALEHRVLEAGGTRAASPGAADVVLEVRSAALGIYDVAWDFTIPLPVLPVGVASPSKLGVHYSRQDGWARLQAFAYEPATGRVVGSWRDLWGYSHVGFFDDILPETTFGGTLSRMAK